MKAVTLLGSILISLLSFSQQITIDTVYSKETNDKYAITIRTPAGYSLTKKYHHVYMTDGSLGTGNYVLGTDPKDKATIPPNCIIIAIAHRGDWEEKRRRDLIPSDISKNAEKNFGHADLFYRFLKNELIPSMDKKLAPRTDRCFIGHSFGGLFCLYTLFKDEQLFDRHYAISPSVWANNLELMKIEEQYYKTHKSLQTKLGLYVGGLEFLNNVLSSTRYFYTTVLDRHYKGLQMEKTELWNANHFSVRRPVVDSVFAALKKLN